MHAEIAKNRIDSGIDCELNSPSNCQGMEEDDDTIRARQECAIADEKFALCSVELQEVINTAGYHGVHKRRLLFDLDWLDVKELGLNTCVRKELEKFLGVARGFFVQPVSHGIEPESAHLARSGISQETGITRTTPCPGRGGANVSNFMSLDNQARKLWTPPSNMMTPFVTLVVIAVGEMCEPRCRECLEDVKHLCSMKGGSALAVLIVELLVLVNIEVEGAHWVLSARDCNGIISATIGRVLERQLKVCCAFEFSLTARCLLYRWTGQRSLGIDWRLCIGEKSTQECSLQLSPDPDGRSISKCMITVKSLARTSKFLKVKYLSKSQVS